MTGDSYNGFNGATSFQKWIGVMIPIFRSQDIGFQWSHFFSEMDRRKALESSRQYLMVFQWSHFFSEMDRHMCVWDASENLEVSMEPLLFRNG